MNGSRVRNWGGVTDKEFVVMPKSRSKFAAAFAAASLIPLIAGGGCTPDGTLPPSGDGATTLVDETFASNPPNTSFSPTAAGRTITVTVSGDATASRIAVVITHRSTGDIVARQDQPTTNSTTVTFVSTNNDVHDVNTLETGMGSNTYTLLVTEL